MCEGSCKMHALHNYVAKLEIELEAARSALAEAPIKYASSASVALRDLVNASCEAYFLREKPVDEYDEYDTMMAPLWCRAEEVLGIESQIGVE